jgi:uncharacterized membrane protein
MMLQIKLFFLSLPVLAILDYLWLGLFMSGFYDRELGPLARRTAEGALAPHWPSAVFVYFLLALGIAVFAVSKSSVFSLAIRGILFGLVVYGVYDLTNYATLHGWPAKLVFVDILWGMTIGGLASTVTAYIAKFFRIL